MVDIRYTYLVGTLLFLIPWSLLFFIRKDVRRLMLEMSVTGACLGSIFEYVWWTRDWWHPHTITNTRIGIEDFLLGFTNGGIASSLYLFVMNKIYKTTQSTKTIHIMQFAGMIVISLIIFAFLSFMGIPSFYCTLIVMCFVSFVLYRKKIELIVPAGINGLMMAFIVIPTYLVLMSVTPGFIEKTWIMENLSQVFLLGIPIEDIWFYFFSGVVCFGIYPFIHEVSLSTTPRARRVDD